ncbi:hypothetical protein [Marasmitruncus massiliensis]|uniref:hypothetical protein n=1 Tax=Marasmitruncus massiliensis TaxID=1944642 RepID=UPI0015E095BD|nr:hypothetical protein [Marasmitruncus massiliensis]
MMKNVGITVYGCEQDEADMFRRLSPCFGIMTHYIERAEMFARGYVASQSR